MGEIINKINCPNGCQNSFFTESVKFVPDKITNLLVESSNGHKANAKKVKVYSCGCCGSTFEMYQNPKNNLLI